jgi:hypothetical protein
MFSLLLMHPIDELSSPTLLIANVYLRVAYMVFTLSTMVLGNNYFNKTTKV